MQLGLHIVERRRLGENAETSQPTGAPTLGVVEFLRQLEGLHGKPDDARPLKVEGLEALLRAAGDDANAVLSLLRKRLVEARRYLDAHRIPIVFVVDGGLTISAHGPILELDGREYPLHSLGGSSLKRLGDSDGWWWSAQMG